MAIMLPSVISPEVKSSAECRIFNWFRDACRTENWIVLHSLGISNHNRVIYGETDFFVLVPNKGIFALEVKGGRVRRENGIWYFTDKHGNTNSKSRGPFDQARDGIFSIIKSIKPRLDERHKHLSNILFGFGVMFPDIDYITSGIDEEQWQVFDARDCDNVCDFICRLSDESKKKCESAGVTNKVFPSVKDVQYLASILRGDFDFAISMNAELRNTEDALIALTEEQYRCLDQLDDNSRCVITGPAGSGKTLLAIEAIKKAVAKGKKVALFCYNSNLANWLSAYFSSSSLKPYYIGTLHSYMWKILKDVGMSLSVPTNTKDQQKFYEIDMPALVLKILSDGIMDVFDEIFIDEAQDLIKNDFLFIFDACLVRGLERGHWTMFGDFSMQAIYAEENTGREMLELLECFTSYTRFRLTKNCRNTKPICEAIQTVTGLETDADWAKTDGLPVNRITWESREEERNKLSNLLKKLESNNIERDKITILSPKKIENSIISLLNRNDIRVYDVKNKGVINFCTIQAYKGLENSVIILSDIENFDSCQLMYVGLSRARACLYILCSEEAEKQFQSLLLRRISHV